MTIVALDVDLRKIYCVTEYKEILAKAEPSPEAVMGAISTAFGGSTDKTVLIEVASAVAYVSGAGAVHNMLRWALWNISAAGQISRHLTPFGYKVLVAPSHVWTRGHNLKLRHEVAGCKLKQKDLRECEAMIHYYKAAPTKWVPLPQYLENL